MTTVRINQVACRAARAPRYHTRCSTERARPAAPPTERRTDTKHARTDGGPSPHARRAPNRAGCSTCVRSVRNGLGSHARPLSRESSRARRRNRRPRAPTSAPPPVGAQRVHSVPQSTRWPRAARSTLRSCDTRPSAHRTGKGVNPSNEAGAHRPSQAKSRLRPRGGPCCAGPSAPQPKGRAADARCTRWLAPDACEQSRNRSHNSKMPWHARASLQMEPRAHGRRTSRNTGPRAAARPEPLAVPSTLGAPETGRALRGSPPVASRLPARELERFATKWPAQTHGRAHAAGLQQGSIPTRAALQQRHPL